MPVKRLLRSGNLIACALLLGTLSVAGSAPCTTLTVGQGGGYDHATIQTGIDAATTGDTVIVYPGTYVENIHFQGKSIILRSSDPTDMATVAATIIDGNSSGSVVTFAGTETSSCILAGFTIRNGQAYDGGDILGHGTRARIEENTITSNSTVGGYYPQGGGLYRCHGTIQNNTISSNSARYGGGLADCGGTIQNNVISSNSASRPYGCGGGLYRCGGTIQNNTIAGNLAGELGGGLFRCGGTIQNNTITSNSGHSSGGGLMRCDGMIQNNKITGNSATYGMGGGLVWCHGTIQDNIISANSANQLGGGLSDCQGTIQNNTITGNSAMGWSANGGGLAYCDGTIQNNTITSNSAEIYGCGLYLCYGTIRNCIIWQNSAPTGAQLDRSSTPSYSCIQDWPGGGEGNIRDDPQFANPAGDDFHLLVLSPCIDTGTNTGAPAVDKDGNPRPYDGDADGLAVCDMGAYEYIPPPTAVPNQSWIHYR